jgi:oligopeptide transport system substrate-binding protein
MHYRSPYIYAKRVHIWRAPSIMLVLCSVLLLLSACAKSGTLIGTGTPAAQQVLTIPFIGTTTAPSFDPTTELDANGKIMMNMLYSGLARVDKNLQVLPDQASWDISADQKTYTFHLKSGITFADGTPVTAQTYIDSWTYAFRPENQSSQLASEAAGIVGEQQLHAGQTKLLSGVKAPDEHTLQVTLTQPEPYFPSELANALFFPVNQKLIAAYKGQSWPVSVVQQGVGTGPFIVKDLVPDVKMSLVPNPHYYGNKLTLTQVNVYFENDARVAYIANRDSVYDLVWNLVQADQLAASALPGFTSAELSQTDTLFFNVTQAPFNSVAVRQAFAAALDKPGYATTTMGKSVLAADTIQPTNMSCNPYPVQKSTYDVTKARNLLKSAYPDASKVPPVIFSYPTSQMTAVMANKLQSMWQALPGIKVKLQPLDANTYQQELSQHTLQFGLVSLHAKFADPYAFLEPFLSTSSQNVSQWHDTDYDQLIAQANTSTGATRLNLYTQAEQLLLNAAPVIPLDHQCMAGIIPNWIQGVAINAQGLYFGDWSDVKILSHT